MKKNNYLLLSLCILTISACTGEKPNQSLATAWQSKHLVEDESIVRKVASTEGPAMCLEDIFNTNTLQREVIDYEKKITGAPVQGYWKHLNLETLPIAQARFLKKFGDSIGDQVNIDSIDYSGCTSLPCIFNRVYGRDQYDVAGYVHYIWYLKFGNYLSLDNKVPDQYSQTPGEYNGKQFKLSDYLYNNDELFGFWRVTHMLQEPFTGLTNLNEIQRVPAKEDMEGYPGACGLASSIGHIRLNNACLRIVSNNMANSFLYIGLIHEMSHMLDYLQAKQKNSSLYNRSNEQDYLDLLGFYKVEYTNTQGKLINEWKIRDASRVIRDYAATSPSENFADTLAYFRQEGETTKTKIDSKQYQWVSKNYFNGEKYDKDGNRSRLIKKYESRFYKNILSVIIDCSKTSQKFQSSYFSVNDFTKSRLTANMLACVSTEAEEISKRLTAHVKIYEPDGCRTLASQNDLVLWNSEVKQSLRNHFDEYIKELANDPEYLEKVEEFNSTTKSRTLANQAIFACYNGSTSENLSSCYEAKVLELAKSTGSQLLLPEYQAIDMANFYVKSHPYSVVVADLYLSYRSILKDHESFIVERTEDLWKMCLSGNHDDNSKPSGLLFYPRVGYLVSSIYNCVNSLLPVALKNIVSKLSFEGLSVVDPAEEKIISEFLAPLVNEELYKLHEAAMKEESEEFISHFSEKKEEIRNQLLTDFSWVSSISDSKKINEGCKVRALSLVTYFPLFHLKRDAFNELIESGPCHEITLDPALRNYLDESKLEAHTQIFSKVEIILEMNAEKRAIYCKSIIPWKWEKTRVTVRVPRKACLGLGWEQVEFDTLQELLMIPAVKKFNITEMELRTKISDLNEGVRTSVELKNF